MNIHEANDEPKVIRKVKEKVSLARQFHAIAEDPYLKIVNLDRQRGRIIGCIWFFLAVGLAFTTSGVHSFLASDLTMDDPLWWGAWAVEPMLAGLLITLLRWETFMNHRGIAIDSGWIRLTKYLLLTATLMMNIFAGYSKGGAFLVLHVLVPLLVFCIAEVLPVISARFQTAREKLLADITKEHSPPASAPAALVVVAAVEPMPKPTEAPASTAATTPTPSATQQVPSPKAKTNGHTVKLPPAMEAKVAAKAQELAKTGQQLTGDHVREIIKVNPAMADAVASRLATQAI